MWLGEAEQRIRFHGPLPEEVEKLEDLLQQHTEFATAMSQEYQTLESIIKVGEEMIKKSSELILPSGGTLSTIANASNQKVKKELQALNEK